MGDPENDDRLSEVERKTWVEYRLLIMSTLDSLEENAKVLKAEIDEIKLKLENFKIWKSLANIIWVFVSAVALLWLQHFLGK